MLILIVGESCVGKTTLANRLREMINGEIYTGKDYLRLARSESVAKEIFTEKMARAVHTGHLIYVASAQEQLSLVPADAVVIRMTADLPLILERFTRRMHGTLPQPVRQMLERTHGCFDKLPYSYHIHNSNGIEEVCRDIRKRLRDENKE